MSRIDLDRRQAQELARLIVENGDRIDVVHVITTTTPLTPRRRTRAEIADDGGRIVASAILPERS